MTKAAEIDPRNYYALGDYQFHKNSVADEDKAAGYYQKAYDADPDRVGASNYAQWLVRYYLNHNRKSKAAEIAKEGGEVYSFSGLVAQAVFFEMTSNYESALKWFAAIDERYNDSTPVLEFCLRYKEKTGDTRFDSEVQNRINKLFPKGVEKVSLADFKSRPTDGVVFMQQNTLMESSGLRKDDVIVAVNGIRVHNTIQYMYARNLRSSLELDLIVWQGDSYREVTASPPEHRFGVRVETYPPQQSR
jgi:tetratricopeptide (TPR) repeat protein